MTLVEVLTVILILVAIGLAVYIFISLRKITMSIQNMQRDFHTLTSKADRVLENLNKTSERIDRITAEAEKQWNIIEDRLYTIRQKLGRFSAPSGILDTVETVKSFTSNIKSLIKGISAFMTSWKSN